MACPMCTGTDCAGACDQGQCYAEQLREQWDDPEGERQQARRCVSNLTDQLGNCVWCGAASGQACLDPGPPEVLI